MIELINSLEFWLLIVFLVPVFIGLIKAFAWYKRIPLPDDNPITESLEELQDYAKQRAIEIKAKHEKMKAEEQNKEIGHA